MAGIHSKVVKNLSLVCSSESAEKSEHTKALTRGDSFRLPPDNFGQLLNSPCLKKPEPTSAEDLSIEEAKERVAQRFLIKRTRRSRALDSPCLARSTVDGKGRFKSLMRHLKHSVKSTLANSLPKTRTITQMTNTLVNTIKSQNIPDCLKYLGLSNGASSGMKRKRDYEENPISEEYAQPCNDKIQEESSSTDLNFATPKMYECGFCIRNFYCVRAYFKHIRRHKLHIRCDGCQKIFSHVICKRRHQIQCVNRAIL